MLNERLKQYPEFKKLMPQDKCGDCNGYLFCGIEFFEILDNHLCRKIE